MKSLQRINAIAYNTLLEVLRQRTLHILFVFGIVLVCSSNFFSQFAFSEQFKFFKDIGYAAISWTGLLVALLAAAQLIPAEIERRTIYVIMSKPVHPFEFIVGKYLGIVALITMMVLVMSAIFAGVLYWKEMDMIHATAVKLDHDAILKIRAEAQDPRLFQAIFLVWGKLCVVAAISVLFSTIATSTIFVVAMTMLIYFIGHLQAGAREVWMSQEGGITWLQKTFLAVIAWFIPDLTTFNLIDEIIAGHAVYWSQTGEILAYSGVYIFVLLLVSTLIFEAREL